MLHPFSSDFLVFDPWLPEKLLKDQGCKPASLKKIFKECDVIYVLASITTKNKNMIDKKLLNSMKANSCLLLLSRASVVDFNDLIDVVKTALVENKAPLSQIKVLPFKEKKEWTLSAKYNIGKKVEDKKEDGEDGSTKV